MKSERIQNLTEKLKTKVERINPGDFRFYNIAHIPLIAQKSAENMGTCNACRENLNKIEQLIDSLPEILSDDIQHRKLFESNKHQIEHHLKKVHGCHFPGYYAAFGSFAGIILGIVASALLYFFNQTPFFNKLNLTALAVFLIGGRGIGILIDRKVFRNNMQL